MGWLLGRCLFLESRPGHSSLRTPGGSPPGRGCREKEPVPPGHLRQSLVLATPRGREPQPGGHRLSRDPPWTTWAAAPLGTHQLASPRRSVSAPPGVTDPEASSPSPAHRGRSQRAGGSWRESQLHSATGRPRCRASFIRWTRLRGHRLHTRHCARRRLSEDETSRCAFPVQRTSRAEAGVRWLAVATRPGSGRSGSSVVDPETPEKGRGGTEAQVHAPGDRTGTRLPKAPGGCLFPGEKASGQVRLQVQRERDPPQAWPGPGSARG